MQQELDGEPSKHITSIKLKHNSNELKKNYYQVTTHAGLCQSK